jgi:2-polyprenyl-6-methoxyphenol hydroxylase-like FAD-dependent oxidoreductase
MAVENMDKSTSFVSAEIKFSAPPKFPVANVTYNIVNNEGFFLAVPLPSVTEPLSPLDQVYRIGFTVPGHMPPPPSRPLTSYIQDLIDRFGPEFLSSDPSINPHPIHVSTTVWSSRFRNRSALADRFFVRYGGAVVFLIGDAAHIHPPLGGQGMNLALRDALGLAKAIADHIKTPEDDGVLEAYAELRRAYAAQVVGLVNGMFNTFVLSLGRLVAWTPLPRLRNWVFWFAGKIPWVRRHVAWRLSGLGMRQVKSLGVERSA